MWKEDVKTDAYLHDKRPPKIRTKVKKNEFTALGSFGIVICLIFVNIYINCLTESGVQTCAPTNSPRLMALDGWYVKRWCAVGMIGRVWSFFSFHRSFVFMGGVVLFNLRSLACGLSFLSFILSGVENLFSASRWADTSLNIPLSQVYVHVARLLLWPCCSFSRFHGRTFARF